MFLVKLSTKKENFKMKFFVLILLTSSSMGISLICPQLGPTLISDTVISGSAPIPSNSNPNCSLECLQIGIGFSILGCRRFDARPTCVCSNGDTWRHLFFYGACADGSSPTTCTCPNGNNFPVQ